MKLHNETEMNFHISEMFCNFAPNLTHYCICMKQTRLADKLEDVAQGVSSEVLENAFKMVADNTQ